MAYTAAQLRAFYASEHIGLQPDLATGAALDAVAFETTSGSRTDASARAFVINSADNDTAVAVLSYQFFTGAAPSAPGLLYLVNSSQNGTDLNDPYYRGFSLENRYINFAANLGVMGEGSAAFSAAYGGLTISQAIDTAYEKIIGSAYATAAGHNPAAAKADILARLPYFTALAASSFPSAGAAQRDMAVKAEIVGYIMAEAMKADVGAYASAMNNFSMGLMDGTARYGADIVAGYAQPAGSVAPVGTVVANPSGADPGGGSGGSGSGGSGGSGGGGTVVPPTTFGNSDTKYAGGDDNFNFVAGSGNNTISAGNGNNTITTGNGDNTITFGNGVNSVTTGSGNDTITVGNGGNTIVGGDGNNTITSGTGIDIITAGVGNDTINAGDGANRVTSGAGNDTITTGAGADVIVMAGNLTGGDTVTAGLGADIMQVSGVLADAAFAGVSGVETLDLTAAATNVTLGAAAQTAGIRIVTNSGNGGVTADATAFTVAISLAGGTGADTFTGGAGADTLNGGAGIDTMNGGAAGDTYVFSNVDADTDVAISAATDVISGGFISGADLLDFSAAGTVGNYQEVLVGAVSLAAFSAAADAALNGTVQYYFGTVGANGFLAFDADGTGVTAIVQLTGVLDMAFGDIV